MPEQFIALLTFLIVLPLYCGALCAALELGRGTALRAGLEGAKLGMIAVVTMVAVGVVGFGIYNLLAWVLA